MTILIDPKHPLFAQSRFSMIARPVKTYQLNDLTNWAYEIYAEGVSHPAVQPMSETDHARAKGWYIDDLHCTWPPSYSFHVTKMMSDWMSDWMGYITGKFVFFRDESKPVSKMRLWRTLSQALQGYSIEAFEAHMGYALRVDHTAYFKSLADREMGTITISGVKPGTTISLNYKARGGQLGNRKTRRQGKR